LSPRTLPIFGHRDEPRPYFGRIDTVRGLGAMAVAGYHISGCCLHGYTLLQHTAWPSATPAQHAVARVGLFLLPAHAFLMTFFVISGFVLRVSLQHGPRTPLRAAAKFGVARLFRFMPIVMVVVLLTATTVPAGRHWSARRWLASLLLLDVSSNTHLWALQLEVCMVPIILGIHFLERRFGAWVLAAVALPASALAFEPRWAGWPPLSYNLFAFVVGMAVPTLGRDILAGLSTRAATRWLVGAVTVMLLTAPIMGVYSRYSAVTEAYAAAIVVTMLAYRSDLPGLRWLDARPLRTLGAAAGSYYVLHMATAPLLTAAADAVIPAGWSAWAPGVVGIAVTAAWLIAIAPFMIVVSQLVEMPGIALGRRTIRRLRLDGRGEPATDTSPAVSRAA
jgi:peptidoglycan/LPS O-acetylase OafA/YrhL